MAARLPNTQRVLAEVYLLPSFTMATFGVWGHPENSSIEVLYRPAALYQARCLSTRRENGDVTAAGLTNLLILTDHKIRRFGSPVQDIFDRKTARPIEVRRADLFAK